MRKIISLGEVGGVLLARSPVLFIRHLLRQLEVDRAVMYGILSRIWSLFAGPVTILLIAARFSPELQGYYYTFSQLLALKIFIELGFGMVIVQFASHEWSNLHLGEDGHIQGNTHALSRLSSLAKLTLRWYTIGGVIAVLGLSIGGYIFFSSSPDLGIQWTAPWLALCVFTGIDLALHPLWSLLEGCNQVKQVYFYRLILAILSNLAVWFSILLGADLWAAPIYSLVGLLWGVFFLGKYYRNFFRSLFHSVSGPEISWRSEILPLQWKIALSWLSGYFLYSLFTPITFKLEGAVVAGQMGITWTLINTLAAVSYVGVTTKMPRFGMLIAKQDCTGLDHLFRKSLMFALGTASLGACAIWSVIALLYWSDLPLATRFLPPLPAGLFLLASIANTIMYTMAVYLRAHKQEPYLLPSVASGLLVGLSTVVLGSHFGVVGMGGGYLVVMVLIMAWGIVIFKNCQGQWHSDTNPATAKTVQATALE